jgi:hypothetical protein
MLGCGMSTALASSCCVMPARFRAHRILSPIQFVVSLLTVLLLTPPPLCRRCRFCQRLYH